MSLDDGSYTPSYNDSYVLSINYTMQYCKSFTNAYHRLYESHVRINDNVCICATSYACTCRYCRPTLCFAVECRLGDYDRQGSSTHANAQWGFSPSYM